MGERYMPSGTEGRIRMLDDSLINKIAAGEVVENPASVVKELIENSIDAGADSIEIEVKDGGRSLIRVRDNGMGMGRQDAEMCIKRHSTSKISDERDLFAIKSLGFRGEALASICAVSEFSLITRDESSIKGTEVAVRNNRIDVRDAGSEKGTTVKVENLFYNVPARKKFLKDASTELSLLIDTVEKYALACNTIAFKLISNQRCIFSTAISKDELAAIASIYGSETAKGMLRIDYADSIISLKGFIGKPSIARKDRARQALLINGRCVKSKEIADAVKQGYHSMLFLDSEPVYVLKMAMDEAGLDVNVHPKKEIVKISKIEMVRASVEKAVKSIIKESTLVLEASLAGNLHKGCGNYAFHKDTQETLTYSDGDKQVETGSVFDNLKGVIEKRNIETAHIGEFRILGQISKTYIICENALGLLIIDQHAAEERVNYEKLKHALLHKAIRKQELLRPITVEITPAESAMIADYKPVLSRLGFVIDEYGKDTIIVRSVPFIFERPSKSVISELISELREIDSKRIMDEAEERIIRFSCRMSVKAGEDLSIAEIRNLISELDKCELPFSCPHGRPTVISISIKEMEKKFRRTG